MCKTVTLTGESFDVEVIFSDGDVVAEVEDGVDDAVRQEDGLTRALDSLSKPSAVNLRPENKMGCPGRTRSASAEKSC